MRQSITILIIIAFTACNTEIDNRLAQAERNTHIFSIKKARCERFMDSARKLTEQATQAVKEEQEAARMLDRQECMRWRDSVQKFCDLSNSYISKADSTLTDNTIYLNPDIK